MAGDVELSDLGGRTSARLCNHHSLHAVMSGSNMQAAWSPALNKFMEPTGLDPSGFVGPQLQRPMEVCR